MEPGTFLLPLKVLKNSVEHARQFGHFKFVEAAPGFPAGRADERQHLFNFVATGRCEQDIEPPAISRIVFSMHQTFVHQNIEDARHGGRVLVGSFGNVQLTLPVLPVQFLQNEPLVHGDTGAGLCQMFLYELFHAARGAFQHEAGGIGFPVYCGGVVGHCNQELRQK
jgi:hypothetical protein